MRKNESELNKNPIFDPMFIGGGRGIAAFLFSHILLIDEKLPKIQRAIKKRVTVLLEKIKPQNKINS